MNFSKVHEGCNVKTGLVILGFETKAVLEGQLSRLTSEISEACNQVMML